MPARFKAAKKRNRAADDVTSCKGLKKAVQSESDEAQPGCSYELNPCDGTFIY